LPVPVTDRREEASVELLTTGVFARESGLSRKALRVYERHDVLLPVAIDAGTGYRYYAHEQLSTARLVARLRRIDMPLRRVREVCAMTSTAAAAAVAVFRGEIETSAAGRVHEADLLITDLTQGTIMTSNRITPTLHTAARHHIGSVRPTNEDLAYGDGRLAAVCDGLGGHARGEEASAAAMEVLVRASATEPGLEALETLVRDADTAVTALASGDERAMSTLTALLLTAGRLALLHVGDGRAYLLRGGQLSRLTQDHSHVQNLVDAGRVSLSSVRDHPDRALLVRALGAGPGRNEPDIALRAPLAGDRYLLCTDGLWAPVPPAEIANALPNGTADEAADRLLDLALQHGAPDNVAVVVADVVAAA
jgi:serine/threonine protein phosphatase PrpC